MEADKFGFQLIYCAKLSNPYIVTQLLSRHSNRWHCCLTASRSDPLAQYDDVQKDTLVPALRFCGQLASWTGNSPINQVQWNLKYLVFQLLLHFTYMGFRTF